MRLSERECKPNFCSTWNFFTGIKTQWKFQTEVLPIFLSESKRWDEVRLQILEFLILLTVARGSTVHKNAMLYFNFNSGYTNALHWEVIRTVYCLYFDPKKKSQIDIGLLKRQKSEYWWNKSNKMQQLRFLFAMALLYMFRVTISPIISSTMLYMATGELAHLGCY